MATKLHQAQIDRDYAERIKLEKLLDNVTAQVHGMMRSCEETSFSSGQSSIEQQIERTVANWGSLNSYEILCTGVNMQAYETIAIFVKDHWYSTHFLYFNQNEQQRTAMKRTGLMGFVAGVSTGATAGMFAGYELAGSIAGGILGCATGIVTGYKMNSNPTTQESLDVKRAQAIESLRSYDAEGIEFPTQIMPLAYKSPLLSSESLFPEERDRILKNMKTRPQRKERRKNRFGMGV